MGVNASMSVILMPISAVYGSVAQLRAGLYRQGFLKQRRLSQPVVSVGNLSVGGTGKTPLVAYLVRSMLRRGFRPSILTRGYRRNSSERLIALDPCRSRRPDPRRTGDEAAMLASDLPEVPIGVSANRYEAGQLVEKKYDVNVHVLDDGFQHLRLARTLDIVTLDVTQGLASHRLLPAGRLREPRSALRRAHLIVLTRTELGESGAVEEAIHQIHPNAPVYHSRVSLAFLCDAASRERAPTPTLEGKRVFAFCGVGNPKAFFSDLERWGMQLAGTRAYRDHHLYSDADVSILKGGARRAGADALVTTEKDLMNLPATWSGGTPLYGCGIELEMIESDAFEGAVFSRLSSH
jgi:tetraacyldisaccharide 4'-kinase